MGVLTDGAGSSRPRLVYVTSRWGEPTQTFVRREADAVRGCGIDVRALSMKAPRPCRPDVAVSHLGPAAIAGGFALAVLRRPRRSARLLARVVRRSSRATAAPQLAAAVLGMAWFGRGVVGDDPLHAHFGWVNATATWVAASLAEVPYSVVLHAFELHRRDRSDGVATEALRAASAVFVVARGDIELVAGRHGVEPSLLRLGVPAAWLDAGPVERTGELIAVGSLLPKKGHDVLIRAVAAAGHPWRLTIIGSGRCRAELEAVVHDLGLDGRVQFTGALPEAEVRQHLQRSAVFCLASRVDGRGDRDGVPVALMEAMALGLPVISTDVGGIPDLVAGAGVLVPAGHVDLLAAALDRLADPAERARVGDRCRDRIAQGWVTEANVAAVAALAR